jgi:hypothetical protein
MTELYTPLPSRRAQRQAREAVAPAVAVAPAPVTVAAPELPSRRALRQAQGPIAPTLSPERDPGQDLDHWVVPSSNVGQTNAAVATLHIEQFPTGEIAGPIDHTGEMILTGPIRIASAPSVASQINAIDASGDLESPGIPRRATEALSIIGRAGPIDEKTKIPSANKAIPAAFATFFGLLVITLIVVAVFTDFI